MSRTVRFFFGVAALLVTAGCSTISHKSEAPLSARGGWGIAPLINNTETAYASERATAILGTLLRARGVESSVMHGAEKSPEKIPNLHTLPPVTELVEKAKQNNLTYLLTGTVTEWRYKVGLDGEPVAGVTLQILDVQTGKTVWSGSAARSGWGRESLSGVGQQLLSSLLETVPLTP